MKYYLKEKVVIYHQKILKLKHFKVVLWSLFFVALTLFSAWLTSLLTGISMLTSDALAGAIIILLSIIFFPVGIIHGFFIWFS